MSTTQFAPGLSVLTLSLAAVAGARGTWSPCGLSMLSAINPVSERARGHRYWLTAIWFVGGALLGGAALGAVGAALAGLMMLGHLSATLACPLAALCCLLAFAGDLPFGAVKLPRIPRQVNERWLAGYRRWVYAGGFGAQIGVGLATYVMTAAVYLVPLLGGLSRSPSFALCVGLTFALTRGLAVLLGSRVRAPEHLLRLHRRLSALEPASLRVVMVFEVAGAAAFGRAFAGLPVVIALGAVVAAAGWFPRVRATAGSPTNG